MPVGWERTFAVLRIDTPGFTAAEPDDSGWPWVTVSDEVTLLHLGVGDHGGLLLSDAAMPAVRAYLRATLLGEGAGSSSDDRPLVAHDDPRGVLIASESRTVDDGGMESSAAIGLFGRRASYETWTSSLSEWGVWVPKPRSTAECLAEVDAVLSPEDRAAAVRTRERYPNQYRSDDAWLALTTSVLARRLGERLRDGIVPRAPVGYMLGDRVSHAEHGVGAIAALDAHGDMLVAAFDGVGTKRVPYKSVSVVARATDEDLARAIAASKDRTPGAVSAPTCALCQGRGWIAPQAATDFPRPCDCKKRS